MNKPFVAEDIALFNDLGQLRAAKNRNVAAFVVRTLNLETDDYASAIWLSGPDGVRPFTIGASEDSAPDFSPDGSTLAFVSKRSGAPQVHLLPLDGGEARQLTTFESGVGHAQWSPDGKRLLAFSTVAIDPNSREQRLKSEVKPDAPEVAWRMPYKSDGMGYLLARTTALFNVDAVSGEARQITPLTYDVLAADWSPDSRRVVFGRTREGLQAHRTDLWIMDADGNNVRQLTSTLATVMGPKWSPDGRWIAFAGASQEGDAQSRLYLVPAQGGEPRMLCDDDVEVGSPDSIKWMDDSSAVMMMVARRASQVVVRVSIEDGALTDVVTGDRHVAEVALADDRLYYFSESAHEPRELFMMGPARDGETQLTHLNAWWWERTPLESELKPFQVPDGEGGTETIYAWLVRAKGAKGPQPLLVEAHGGPNAFALLGFPWNTYWNSLCSKGWTIIVPHAVGSTGFGRRFAERIYGRWGEADFPQFMAVIDALQSEGIANEEVVIVGKSYGGFMSAWAVGHTHRFKAAIIAAPVANLESHFGSSDGGYYSQPYVLSGERHIAADRYRELSPVNYIANCTTPCLILQGKEDERCPRGQAEELFALLRRVGKCESEMVLYPGGDHHLYETGKPSHRMDAVNRMVEWIERHTTMRVDEMRQAAD